MPELLTRRNRCPQTVEMMSDEYLRCNPQALHKLRSEIIAVMDSVPLGKSEFPDEKCLAARETINRAHLILADLSETIEVHETGTFGPFSRNPRDYPDWLVQELQQRYDSAKSIDEIENLNLLLSDVLAEVSKMEAGLENARQCLKRAESKRWWQAASCLRLLNRANHHGSDASDAATVASSLLGSVLRSPLLTADAQQP